MKLSQRQRDVFDIFSEKPLEKLTGADFSRLNIERTTLFRELKKIVAHGLVRQEGRGYRMDQHSLAFMEWDLSRPPHERQPVGYNPRLLKEYNPNRTFLLSDAQLKALDAVAQMPGASGSVAGRTSYERVLESWAIDLAHASSNLEGVNVSWLDTKALLGFGERPDGLSEKQMKIVLNHKAAISFLMEHGNELDVCKKDLFDLHTLLIAKLLGDETALGTLRKVVVRFDDSRYLPPDNPHQLKEAFELFCEKASAIANPHEQAFFTMMFLPYLQPFLDGNKRTSRLAMNIPLIKNELAPFSFSHIKKRDYMLGLLAFYERGRHELMAAPFVEAYKKSAAKYRELIDFVNDGGALATISESGAEKMAENPPEAPQLSRPVKKRM